MRATFRRAVVAVVAIGVASSGMVLAIRALGTQGPPASSTVSSATTPMVYEITLPSEATPTETKGTYEIDAKTNLPELTRVYVSSQSSEAGGAYCCAVVGGGELVVPVVNNDCEVNGEQVTSRPFTLTFIVAPDYSIYRDGPPLPSPSMWQPASVMAVLGVNFEELAGDGVRQVGDMNELVVTGDYQLPSDTCTPQ